MPTTAKPLQVLFDAIHHGKHDFRDFLHGDIAANYTVLREKRRSIYRPTTKLKAYHAFLNTFVFEYLTVNPRVLYSLPQGR